MRDESDFPADFNRLVFLWKDIKAGFFDAKDPSEAERYEMGLASAAWAWVPDFQELLPGEVNRRGDMLLGPFFCSADNPWPDDDGQPMIPLAQINLDNASSIGRVDLGTGLLQVFCRVNDRRGQATYERVIDRESVISQDLTEPANFSDDISGFASLAWAQEGSSDRSSYGEKCLQITGYTEKKFTLWMPSPIADEHDLSTADAALKAKIVEFDQIIAKNSDDWSPGGFHLFGTFYPIQYYPAERDKVLFTLESNHGFNFGDGQAQIFYKLYEDDPERGAYFCFEWSCY